MLSKNQVKLINRLKQKKYRHQYGLFQVEGVKSVNEFISAGYTIHQLFVLEPYSGDFPATGRQVVSESELRKISNLKTPNKVVAVFEIPQKNKVLHRGLSVVLDDVNDPGNLGTIIRLCDWFGVDQLVCSNETVDCYNPKTVQATMGSLARINIVYTDVASFLADDSRTKYGTFMEGDNIYRAKLPAEAVLVMGNEANGISELTARQIDKKVSIPRFGKLRATESLNVATATAVFLSEFRRNE